MSLQHVQAALCSQQQVSTAARFPAQSRICPGVMMDLRAGRSPWIPIATAAASALLPKNHLREIEKVPDSNKSFITTTFAKYPQIAIKSPQQANWRIFFCTILRTGNEARAGLRKPPHYPQLARENARSRDRTRVPTSVMQASQLFSQLVSQLVSHLERKAGNSNQRNQTY